MLKLMVLAFSYFIVDAVELVDVFYSLKHGSYYILLGLTAFVIFTFCHSSKDRLLHYYSYIQLGALVLYTCMIDIKGFYIAEVVFYDGAFNLPIFSYSSVIMTYELVLLAVGVTDVFAWLRNDNNMHHNSNYRA